MEKQITVLIADDNQLMRKTLWLLISTMKEVKLAGEATNGKEAIELAESLSPDIILMDINMSPVNGFEATRKILKKNPDIKIIGVSLHTEPSYAKNIIQLGAKGYVAKSSPPEEIKKAISQVAAGGKYIDKCIADKL